MLLLLDTKEVFTWPSLEKNLHAVPRLHIQDNSGRQCCSALEQLAERSCGAYALTCLQCVNKGECRIPLGLKFQQKYACMLLSLPLCMTV